MNVCRECGSKLSGMEALSGICGECRGKLSTNMNERAACQRCGRFFRKIELTEGKCAACAGAVDAGNGLAAVKATAERRKRDVFVTTEMSADQPISQRLGIVGAEAVLGLNALSDLGAGLRDVFGGRSKGYQNAIRQARAELIADLRQQAFELGADAVMATAFSYSDLSGGGKSMILMAATGTAVCLLPRP